MGERERATEVDPVEERGGSSRHNVTQTDDSGRVTMAVWPGSCGTHKSWKSTHRGDEFVMKNWISW